jgi:MFS family permease
LLDDNENPQMFGLLKKWRITMTICVCTVLVTCASSLAVFTESALVEEFHVPPIVSVLSISLFVQGLALGQLFVAPFSELYGRQIVYRVAFTAFLIVTVPVAFAPNISELPIPSTNSFF